MAHYLVTGGAGFIGSHLVTTLLDQGHRVTVLDDLSTGRADRLPKGVRLIVADTADMLAVLGAMAGVDGCFHLAAIASVQRSVEDWTETHRVNLTGSITVFDAARARRIPVVYASSAAIYGNQDVLPIAETASPSPRTAYGADKLGSELHARVAGLVHGVATMGFRFFNVYGPGQDPQSPYSGVISVFIDRIRRGEPIVLHGDGYQTRDFVYVGDVVRHLIAGMGQASVEAPVLNVCTGQATSIRSVATLLRDIAGSTVDIQFAPERPGDIRSSIGSPRRATDRLSVRAETPLSLGLTYTFQAVVAAETAVAA